MFAECLGILLFTRSECEALQPFGGTLLKIDHCISQILPFSVFLVPNIENSQSSTANVGLQGYLFFNRKETLEYKLEMQF